MIHIKYKLDKSNFHGIGLFTDEDLPKGILVYTASPLLDVNISKEDFETLSDSEKKEIRWWGFWDEGSNVWHVDFDVSKFINHSKEGTLTQDETKDETYLVTTRNLQKGEELTQNYLEFESEEDLLERGIKIE